MAKKIRKFHPYRCKAVPLPGRRHSEVMPRARKVFRTLQRRTKRRPYVRSVYFRRDKVFFDYFWSHLQQKSLPDRTRRLKYLPCAIELLRHSGNNPSTQADRDNPRIVRHKFFGVADGQRFSVIVRQDIVSGQKQLLSIFPEK